MVFIPPRPACRQAGYFCNMVVINKCYPIGINEKYIAYDYSLNGGHMEFKMSNDRNRYYHEIDIKINR
jgi:hypothetical protein